MIVAFVITLVVLVTSASIMWGEEHFRKVIVLQTVHFSNLAEHVRWYAAQHTLIAFH
jgi:hypothetical protein